MSNVLPEPKDEAMIYEDEKLYACLATHPISKGHVVVVWKDDIVDLGRLHEENYEYLMGKVDEIRKAMMKALDIPKVYLLYMDEVKHVHWHLIPRYNEKGCDVFLHEPKEITDFSLADKIKENL